MDQYKAGTNHPFNFSKSNIVFGILVAIAIVYVSLKLFGFDRYGLGRAIGHIIGVFIAPSFMAILVWFIGGRKEYGGTTTFNVVLIIVLAGVHLQMTSMSNILPTESKAPIPIVQPNDDDLDLYPIYNSNKIPEAIWLNDSEISGNEYREYVPDTVVK